MSDFDSRPSHSSSPPTTQFPRIDVDDMQPTLGHLPPPDAVVRRAPVSAQPVSARPISAEPVSARPVSARPISSGPAITGRAVPAATPTASESATDASEAGTELVAVHRLPRARGLAAWLRLPTGRHVVARGALDAVTVGAPATGLMLGHDQQRRAVSVRLFREEATRAALIGGTWAARLLVFRALALGARVVVFTATPTTWEGFGRWATGREDRVAIMGRQQPVAVAASAGQPALLVYDVGLSGPANPPPLGPWQAQLTVLRQLTAYGFPALQSANVVMLQRLAAVEAMPATSLLHLNGQTLSLMQSLNQDMLALLGGGADRYLWLSPTDIERQNLGAPSR